MPLVSPAFFLVLAMPFLGKSRRLNVHEHVAISNASEKFWDTYCEKYASSHPEHATCVGCTTLMLPDGGRCQWSAESSSPGKRCVKTRLGFVWDGYTTEPQSCPELPVDAFKSWHEKGGGQLHFIWWGDGGEKYLNSATASPTLLAGAVNEPSKVHYWYDPSYSKLEGKLSKEQGLFTLHALDSTTVSKLAVAANLDGADVWKLVNNLKMKKGNGLAASKNFLSWLVLYSFGGQFFDTTVQILKPDVNKPPIAEELEVFKAALNEPVQYVTFPFSELRDRYIKRQDGKPTVFETRLPWITGNVHLNRFPAFHDEHVEFTLLGNPEVYGKVSIQPSNNHMVMPLADVMVPSLDVWAIKAPQGDSALRAVAAEFFARARLYGLIEGNEASIEFSIQLFGRDWDVGILMDIEKKNDFQSALTMDRKTTVGNHFDVRAVCLKSLSMMSVHAGLAKANGLDKLRLDVESKEIIRQRMWQRHVIAPAADWDIGHPVVAEWRMIKYSGQTHVA